MGNSTVRSAISAAAALTLEVVRKPSDGSRCPFVSRFNNSHNRVFGLVLAIAFVGATVLPGPAPGRLQAAPVIQPTVADPYAHDSWQVIYLNNERIGYTHNATRSKLSDGARLIYGEIEIHMTLKRLNQSITLQMFQETEETEDGRLLSYKFESRNPPAGTTLTSGRIEGDTLHFETTVAGRTRKSTKAWDSELKSPGYQDRLLRESPLRPGESRSFKVFDISTTKASTVRLAATGHRFEELLDGEKHKLLEVKITQSILPGITTLSYQNESGDAAKAVTPLLGLSMTFYTVDAQEALKEIVGGELDIALNTLVPVKRIPRPLETKRVVYRLTTPGVNPAEFIVIGPTQSVRSLSPEEAELTVTALPPPSVTRLSKQHPEYLQPTQFLQSDDPRVIDHVTKAVGGEIVPTQIAVKMEKYVQKTLRKKNFSTALASAAEVAKNLEGDCTEHAVLLAAMLRAKQVPSRVAVGLVYSERLGCFIGHMWTEAYLGDDWVPLDATLGKGGVGATHIKLAETSLDDAGPVPATAFLPLFRILGKLKIEVVAIE